MRLLVRVRPAHAPESPADRSATLARLVDAASDSIVVTDSSGRILAANPAFLSLVQVDAEIEVKGRSLPDWMVGSELLDELIPQVRRQGIASRRAAQLRQPGGQRPALVEISATC